MNPKKSRGLDRILGAISYLLAVFMMYAGIATMFMSVEPMGGALGFLYDTRIALVAFGTVFFGSGLTLLLGKIRKKRRWVSRGLMAIYLCFMFAAILNGVAWNWQVESWSPNALAALITGGLWLWWKFKTQYVTIGEFSKDAVELRQDDKS